MGDPIMNPILILFANGNAFFIGMGLVALATAGHLRQNRLALRSLLICGWLVGIVLVVLSATPIFFWVYGAWLGLCLLGLILLNRRVSPGTASQSKLPLIAAILGFSVAMCVMELPYHQPPSIVVSGSQTVFVLGDSISAGTIAKDRSWPAILSDLEQFSKRMS